jgi:RNA polymerase primary sigma factor
MSEGQEARTKLVDANGGLVNSIAKKHFYSVKQANQAGGGLGSILTLQDMIQEGNLGLMEAAERFEPERGNRFSTYATYWIRQRILRSISEYSRIIRLPAHVHQTVRKIHKAKKEMEKEIGRTPSLPELAHYLEMSVDKLRKYTDSSRTVLSLELPVDVCNYKGEDKRTLGDRIASDSPTPEEDAQAESLRRDINDVVNELPERERDVLVARFGLDDGTPKTVEETSKRLSISRDRVRLIEARALNKLRHPQRNYKLKEYVGGSDPVMEDEREEDLQLQMSPERIWSF